MQFQKEYAKAPQLTKENLHSNAIPYSVTHSQNQKFIFEKGAGQIEEEHCKNTFVKEVERIKALRSSAPLHNKHFHQLVHGRELPSNEPEDAEQGDDIEQGLLHNEKEELSS